MEYKPITEKNKGEFIEWIRNLSNDIKDKLEDTNTKNIFPNSEAGDMATVKDLIGNLLATLEGKPVTI